MVPRRRLGRRLVTPESESPIGVMYRNVMKLVGRTNRRLIGGGPLRRSIGGVQSLELDRRRTEGEAGSEKAGVGANRVEVREGGGHMDRRAYHFGIFSENHMILVLFAIFVYVVKVSYFLFFVYTIGGHMGDC